jgi:hypothetical protein
MFRQSPGRINGVASHRRRGGFTAFDQASATSSIPCTALSAFYSRYLPVSLEGRLDQRSIDRHRGSRQAQWLCSRRDAPTQRNSTFALHQRSTGAHTKQKPTATIATGAGI